MELRAWPNRLETRPEPSKPRPVDETTNALPATEQRINAPAGCRRLLLSAALTDLPRSGRKETKTRRIKRTPHAAWFASSCFEDLGSRSRSEPTIKIFGERLILFMTEPSSD